MFGKIGEKSDCIKEVTLGECSILNPKKPKNIQLDQECSFVPMQNVSERGVVDSSTVVTYDEVKTGYTYFEENDILFAKITPCMENGKGGIAVNLKNGIGFGSTEFHVLRPVEGISTSTWLYGILSFDDFRQEASKSMTGSAGQRRVPISYLSNFKVVLPSMKLQNEYSVFVEQVDKSKYYRYKFISLCRKIVNIEEEMLCQTLDF